MSEHATAPGSTLITGATGNTGRRITTRLTELGYPVRAASRHPAPAHGTEPTHFDWYDTATHTHALDQIRRLYLIAPIGDPDPATTMLPFLHRARDAGVRRAVLLSSSAVPEGADGLGAVHRALRDQFPEWAVLQPSWFMQNFTGDHLHAATIRTDNEIVTATGDGRVGFIDATDIAEVAVRALTDPHPHNTAHVITGPEALSYADIAAALSDVTGRPIRHRTVPYETMRDRLTTSGIPAQFAALLARLDQSIASGAEDRVTSTVAEVTGRPPTSFGAFAAAHAGQLGSNRQAAAPSSVNRSVPTTEPASHEAR